MEPDVTKTVSYFRVSIVMLITASDEVMKDSFLQEKKTRRMDIDSIPRVFIELKNNRTISH